MKGEKQFSYLMVAVSAALLVGSLFIVPFDELTTSSPGGYPIFISILCLVLSLVIAFGKRKGEEEEDPRREQSVFNPVVIAFIVMLILYVAAILLIHYVLATLLFLFAGLFYLKRDNWKRAILISYIGTFMILLVFKYLFSVIMP